MGYGTLVCHLIQSTRHLVQHPETKKGAGGGGGGGVAASTRFEPQTLQSLPCALTPQMFYILEVVLPIGYFPPNTLSTAVVLG